MRMIAYLHGRLRGRSPSWRRGGRRLRRRPTAHPRPAGPRTAPAPPCRGRRRCPRRLDAAAAPPARPHVCHWPTSCLCISRIRCADDAYAIVVGPRLARCEEQTIHAGSVTAEEEDRTVHITAIGMEHEAAMEVRWRLDDVKCASVVSPALDLPAIRSVECQWIPMRDSFE